MYTCMHLLLSCIDTLKTLYNDTIKDISYNIFHMHCIIIMSSCREYSFELVITEKIVDLELKIQYCMI